MLSRMTIRTRLLVVAAVPAVALAAATLLLRSGAPASRAMLATAVAGVGVVAALALAISVARSITAPLAQLGDAAERASHLQNLVEALRRPGGGDKDLALTPVGLPAGGEIGSVAQAFDEFQGAAARLAVGQAALLNKTVAEKGTVEVFVNLARRMQGLVDHQIEFLDGLEAEEQDPETLENLFRLDQLATRVRRNAESLLTLAGAASARSWERPLAMSDVIRAGMAEVEDIGRVDLLLDDNAAMLGNVAADAAHLLSELLENATRWSPPDTRVEVSGTPAAGGYAVTIEDRGIGMAEDALAEANHILTGPPLAEATVARSLGLVVAGRLARRLGIVVRLASAGTGGIVAKVLVPPTLMVAADDTIGLDEITAGSARALPFALARQEKRARISSQRKRGPRPVPGSQQAGEATITQLPEPHRAEPPAAVEPEPGSHWLDAMPDEGEWRAADAESHWTDAPAPAEPAWPAADVEWPAAEQSWSPAATEQSWPAAEHSWPADSVADEARADDWSTPAMAGTAAAEPVAPVEPELPVREPAAFMASEPAWPAAVAEEPLPAPDAADAGPVVVEPVPVAAPGVAEVAAEPEPMRTPVAADPVPVAADPVLGSAPAPMWEPAVHAAPVRVAETVQPAAPPARQQAGVTDVPALPVRPRRPAPVAEPVAAAGAPAVHEPVVAPAPPAPQAPAQFVAAAPPPVREPQYPPPPPTQPYAPPAQAAGPVHEPVVAAATPPVPETAPAPGPPTSIRPTPSVRPARFAATPSRSLAGAAPQRATEPSVEAKEDEYRRHLERATAAGLVRRIPKASLPKDTGGGAKRAPKTGGDAPVVERLPDEVRSLLSSYRSGVQRGRADGPSDDQRTTTPQEQP